MSQSIKDYLGRFYRHQYLGYLRHYYNAAVHPHPKRVIAVTLLATILIFSLAIYSTVAIFEQSFEGNPTLFYLLTIFMYLIGLATIPTIVLWIQGYRHRDKLRISEVPDRLPRNSGHELWVILFFVIITMLVKRFA